MSSRFSTGLAKLKAEGRPIRRSPTEAPAIPPAVGPEAASQGERSAAIAVPPSRQGKKAIAAYFDPAVRKQLALLAVQEERTQADLLAEAINLLFEKYDQPPIAKA